VKSIDTDAQSALDEKHEPIPFSGTVKWELFRANERRRDPHPVLAGFFFSGLWVFAYSAFFHHGRSSWLDNLLFLPATVFCSAATLMACLRYWIYPQRDYRQRTRRNINTVSGSIGRDVLFFSNAEEKWWIKWSLLEGASREGDLLLLGFGRGLFQGLTLDKNFFQSESQWEDALEIIDSTLAARNAAMNAISDDPEWAIAKSRDGIPFSERLTLGIQLSQFKLLPRIKLFPIYLAVGVAAFSLAIRGDLHANPDMFTGLRIAEVLIGVVCVVVGLLFMICWLLMVLWINGDVRIRNADAITGVMGSEYVEVLHPSFRQQIKWEGISAAAHQKDLLLLVVSNVLQSGEGPRSRILLHKRFFESESYWQQALALVDKKIGLQAYLPRNWRRLDRTTPAR